MYVTLLHKHNNNTVPLRECDQSWGTLEDPECSWTPVWRWGLESSHEHWESECREQIHILMKSQILFHHLNLKHTHRECYNDAIHSSEKVCMKNCSTCWCVSGVEYSRQTEAQGVIGLNSELGDVDDGDGSVLTRWETPNTQSEHIRTLCALFQQKRLLTRTHSIIILFPRLREKDKLVTDSLLI